MENLQSNYQQWIEELVKSKANSDKEQFRQVIAQGNHRQDVTRPTLESLLQQGYTTVQWDSQGSREQKCMELHGQQWTLADFLTGLMHDAPMFEKSHPGCLCKIVCTGPGMQNIAIDTFGNVEQI
jgi:hypothetical protein